MIVWVLGLADLTVTSDRMEAISFSYPFISLHYLLYIKNPMSTFNFKAYTDPLQHGVWVAIIGFCVLMPFVLHKIVR